LISISSAAKWVTLLICAISNSCKLLGYDIHITGITMNKSIFEGGEDEKLSQRTMV
jgi:hypothetical protein